MQRIDLSGQRFGKLVAIEPVGVNRCRQVIWRCECDCGKIIKVPSSRLINGSSKSCGCSMRKYNKYDMRGKYGKIIFDDGSRCIFDKEFVDFLKDHYWRKLSDGHVVGKVKGKNVNIARFIIDIDSGPIPDGLVIDHINRNPLDNRLDNLRACTHQENLFNRNVPKHNTSGVVGVSLFKRTGKYTARIGVDNKTIYLGCFDTIEEAMEARRDAEEKYFGEFAPH